MRNHSFASVAAAAAAILLSVTTPAKAQSDWFQQNQQRFQLRQLQDNIDTIQSEQAYQRARQIERDSGLRQQPSQPWLRSPYHHYADPDE